MIPIPLSLAIGLYVVGILAFVLYAWKRSDDRILREGRKELPGVDTIRCEICGNVYADTPADGLSVCPLCHSYNDIRSGESAGQAARGRGRKRRNRARSAG